MAKVNSNLELPIPRAIAERSGHPPGGSVVKALDWQGRTFVFREPITLRFEVIGDLWTCECHAFGLLAHGPSRATAAASLAEDFADYWDLIAMADDAALAPDALRLKAKLIGSVAAILPA